MLEEETEKKATEAGRDFVEKSTQNLTEKLWQVQFKFQFFYYENWTAQARLLIDEYQVSFEYIQPEMWPPISPRSWPVVQERGFALRTTWMLVRHWHTRSCWIGNHWNGPLGQQQADIKLTKTIKTSFYFRLINAQLKKSVHKIIDA